MKEESMVHELQTACSAISTREKEVSWEGEGSECVSASTASAEGEDTSRAGR